ncbi:hypothetical protein SPRG_01132 [Saprolegnia parasitica CBS 223.65]|uniref:Uncharacterized protein n=1 Tax=Saprolegnia parasitica (strain CBS 223.65) TaxID=695850 RepID=A0A067CX35_SAPPC|nr:hypothetical protein SPRG_01132 [Saprolegnia parasitica CBS 223.65]KDO35068.1 hypothetical protein SPRG_01132 [Saprolegnia parasitica CBS 223.65]|eukprot:XP_012194721.1 hypothetical protein SPRG_01132 [Saprolegnia parasitica CBS 223.65]
MAAVQAHEFELDLSAVRARNTVLSRTYGRQVLLTKAAKDREGPASARRSSPPTRPPNRGVQTARAPARGSGSSNPRSAASSDASDLVDSLEVALRAMEAQSVQRRIVASPSRPVMALDGRRNKAPAERSREAWFQKQEYYLRKRRVAESDRATYLTTPSLAIKPISIEILRTLQSNDDALQLQGRLYAQKLDGLRRKLQSTAQTIDALRRRGAPLSDVDACREAIEAMESAIAVFRSNQHAQFDDLVVHEGQLERDLHRFETKMDAWSNERPIDRPTTGKAPRVAAANDVETRQDIERVRMLDSLLHETGDACGGWAYDDHAHFVAVLHASGLTDPDDLVSYFTASTVRSDDDGHNNHDDDDDGHNDDDDDAVANEIALLDQRASVAAKLGLFRTKCHAKLPFKTTSAVQTHLEWYAQHLSLLQAKKKTIVNWRERKKSLERRETTAASHTSTNERPRSSRNVTERQRKKTQILEWKAAKAQQSQRVEPETLTAQASVATLKRIEIKQKIALYKLEKEEEQMRQASLSELMKPMARAPSKEQLMTSAERAVHAAKARLEKVLASAAATRQAAELPLRPKSSRQLLASASSDLLKPTAASAARAVTPDEVEQQSAARAARAAHRGYIPGADGATHVKGRSFGHVPSQPRATPEWRKRI